MAHWRRPFFHILHTVRESVLRSSLLGKSADLQEMADGKGFFWENCFDFATVL